MANLIFYYGTMESGKTTKLIQDHYNYTKHGISTVVVKPVLDTKGGDKVITRRGEFLKADITLGSMESFFSEENCEIIKNAEFMLVDEVQFFSKKQVKELWLLAHMMDIMVIAYGLKNNFKGDLFEGSSALFSLADLKYELTVNCLCGNMASFNARKENGIFVQDGAEVVIDGESIEVEYVPLCSDCYLKYVEKKAVMKRIKK